MRYLFPIIILVFTVSACQEQRRFCDENKVSEFCFDNTTMDTAFVYVNNEDTIVIPPQLEICEFIGVGVVEYNIVVGDTVGPSDSLSIIDCQFFEIEI